MKKLQNNFTTPEQSKRLLELGVPADSADCYRDDVSSVVRQLPEGMNFTGFSKCVVYEPLPCWSVGRLIEILTKCHTEYRSITFSTDSCGNSAYTVLEMYLRLLIEAIKSKSIDFSKLED